MTSTSEFVSNEKSRRKILNRIREQNVPNSHLFQEFLVEYELLAEYRLLQKNGPHRGVYVVPSSKSTLIWFGVIFVHSGYFAGGVFKFRIHIPPDFPNNSAAPKLVFDPPIFHPLVNPNTGELDLTKVYQTWRPHKDRLWHLIPWMRKVFLKIDFEGVEPSNPEAAHLFTDDQEGFKTKVDICVKFSQQILYEQPKTNDPHEIRFVGMDEEENLPLRAKMLRLGQLAQNPPKKCGYSWISPTQNRPFSK